jgi:hypothetical protein
MTRVSHCPISLRSEHSVFLDREVEHKRSRQIDNGLLSLMRFEAFLANEGNGAFSDE